MEGADVPSHDTPECHLQCSDLWLSLLPPPDHVEMVASFLRLQRWQPSRLKLAESALNRPGSLDVGSVLFVPRDGLRRVCLKRR